MFLFQKIEAFIYDREDAYQQIGTFLLEHRHEIGQFNMTQIAEKTFTSKPSLVRFAQALGYSGWRDFIYAYTHEVATEENNKQAVDPNFPFQADSDSLEIIENILSLQMQSLRDTASLLEADDLDDAAEIIFKAQAVALFGISPNSYYAEIFKRKLLAIGKNVRYFPEGEAGMLSRFLGKEDCAIFISYSGNNGHDYPLCYIPILKRNQVPLISLTSGGDGYLAQESDLVLPIYSREKLYSKIGNFATEESILFLLNVLYAKVFALDYAKHKALKIDLSRELESQNRSSTLSDLSEQ